MQNEIGHILYKCSNKKKNTVKYTLSHLFKLASLMFKFYELIVLLLKETQGKLFIMQYRYVNS